MKYPQAFVLQKKKYYFVRRRETGEHLDTQEEFMYSIVFEIIVLYIFCVRVLLEIERLFDWGESGGRGLLLQPSEPPYPLPGLLELLNR